MSANRNIYIVGLTGGIASGKSEAARMLGDMGARCVDADAISRRLTSEPGETLDMIRAEFGDGVFDEEGTLIRSKLADIVFNDPAKRKALDALTHPAIQKTMLDEVEQADKAGEKIVFLNVPLLFETGADSLCDKTILLTADLQTRLRRVTERDGCSREDVLARIRNQMPEEEKTARADFVVDNSGSLEELHRQLEEIAGRIHASQ